MRSNFIKILESKVEIPIIQRDYAQGRTDNKTNKIRKEFLDAIFDFILKKKYDRKAELDLDFIYGLNRETSTFVPIDGQQRLTTLWLLYWFVSVKEKIQAREKHFLKNFIYETRHSTTQFCRCLVDFDAEFSNDLISEEIKNQPWYFETWNYDPGIQAMLVVLNDINRRYAKHDLTDLWDFIGNSTCPFYFYKLDMDKVGLTDDLYIKMNSRGKPLTEFEYFKSGFTELLTDSRQRERFETSIDGFWMDTIWQIVFEHDELDEDIALVVDQAFLNLFNFISSTISFRNNIKTEDDEYYQDTENTSQLLSIIYSDARNQSYLFNVLDALCLYHRNNPAFWNDTFYYSKTDFDPRKTRFYFQHGETNLLKRCLFHYSDYRGLSFPEQIILLACFTHFWKNDPDFGSHIRVVRNLVVNSENELRETSLGNSFREVEQFMSDGNLNNFSSFKTDQIEEERQKRQHLGIHDKDDAILKKLEDSDIFRGSISLINLDTHFSVRADRFLILFDEDDITEAYNEKCNLLLCFGDYSQDEGAVTNLISKRKRDIRAFFTTPGYNKEQLYGKTQKVVNACLDFFISNPSISPQQKIDRTIVEYSSKPKDWRYYFLRYPSFREYCQFGYYSWRDSGYVIWKMSKKQFNGYHWDPFLHEIFLNDESGKLAMGNYGKDEKLVVFRRKTKVEVSSLPEGNGFQLENGNITVDENSILNDLKGMGVINKNHELLIDQNDEGYDTEDRIETLKSVLQKITG